MKIKEILGLNSLYDVINDSRIPFKTAYKFAKLKKDLEDGLKFYQEQMNKIINDYAQKDEKGQCVFTENHQDVLIKEGLERECHAKIAELENCELDIDISFTVDELENLSLTVNEMSTILPLIK